MRRTLLVIAVAWGLCPLFAVDAAAQSRQQGVSLYNQALNLQNKAKSKGDLDNACRLYERAIQVFESAGNHADAADAACNLGNVFTDLGRYHEALKVQNRALALDGRRPRPQFQAEILGNMGNAYWKLGQLDRALDSYQKSLAIHSKIGNARGQGFALHNMGNIYRDRAEYARALDFFEKAFAIKTRLGDAEGLTMTVNGMGTVHLYRGEYDKALALFRQSLDLAGKRRDMKSAKHALMNIGLVHCERGEFPQGLEAYRQALVVSRQLGDLNTESKTLSNMGEAYRELGQFDQAMEHLETSLEIRKKIGDEAGQASSYMGMGLVNYGRGKHDRALELFGKSLELARRVGDRRLEARIANNVGNTYADRGEYERALELYKAAAKGSEQIGDFSAAGNALSNVASVFSTVGEHDKALGLYERVLESKRKLKETQKEANTMLSVGEIHQFRGSYDEAMKWFRHALQVQEAGKLPTRRTKHLVGMLYLELGKPSEAEPFITDADFSTSLGLLALAKRNYAHAIACYEACRKRAEESRDADQLFTGYTGLGVGYESLGDDVKAAEQFRKAINLTEELRSSLDPRARETFFDVKISGFYRTSPYEGLARVLMRMHKPVDALNISEFTKARVFAEAASRKSAGAGTDIPDDVRRTGEDLTAQLTALKKARKEALDNGRKATAENLEPRISELEKRRTEHVKLLREKYPLFAATRYPEPMDLAQTALTADEWVLAYDVTDTGVIAYLMKGKELRKGVFKAIRREELDALVRSFRDPLEVGDGKELRARLGRFDFRAGWRLSEVLLGDVLSVLPKGAPVVVIPDDCLGVLPFEMLVLNQGGSVATDRATPRTRDADYFGDRNPISYYQSITALTLARHFSKQRGGGNRVLVIDDPVFEDDDPRLQTMDQEKKRQLVGSLPDKVMSAKTEKGVRFPRLSGTAELGRSLKELAPGSTDEFSGMEACKAALQRTRLDQYGSVVFATHGYGGLDLPGIQEPVLVLTLVGQPKDGDGFLRMSEVMGLRLDARIVALTACQTGLGRRISGEGTMGMGRAFQYAGAKAVLMSLWSVAETSSVTLVKRFFTHLNAGKTGLEALESAKREIRAQGYDHPFYWAPFILVGEAK
ncbi:MAG: CHAT domain-containing tetratricopeptide repeat protein [Thermodesulfobacteriota bacterium]